MLLKIKDDKIIIDGYEIKNFGKHPTEVNVWVTNIKTGEQGCFTSSILYDKVKEWLDEIKKDFTKH